MVGWGPLESSHAKEDRVKSRCPVGCDRWDGREVLSRGVPDASGFGRLDVLDEVERLLIAPWTEVAGFSSALPVERGLRVQGVYRIFAGEAVIAEGDQDLACVAA